MEFSSFVETMTLDLTLNLIEGDQEEKNCYLTLEDWTDRHTTHSIAFSLKKIYLVKL